ncbi:MAG: glycosyltransferase [Coriobacteriales bacterium]|jgi:glycosyltransferase involved in cell wall biosynthesis
MPQEAPDVTIIVPTYNTGKYLDQCLDSVCQNTEARLEVIVINDGSTDDSLQIMRRHEQQDPRIRVIDKPNGGYGSGCNRGLAEARGTYVAIVEPDDFVKPGFYDAMLAYARTFDPLPEIVKTPYVRVTMPDTPQQRLYHCAYYHRLKIDHQPFTLSDQPRLFQHHPSIWSAMYLRSFLEEHAIRFKEAKGGGWVDNPFLAETLVQAKSIVYLDEDFYCYREDRPGSSSMLKSTDLAFTRWNDMSDVLDRLGVTDHGIRRAHVVRGIAYLSGILEEANIAGSPAEDKMRHMFERMDPVDVLKNNNVSNDMKKLYCKVRGIEPKFDPWLYRRALVSEFNYAVRNNGFAYGMSRFMLFFGRRARINRHNPTVSHSAGI